MGVGLGVGKASRWAQLKTRGVRRVLIAELFFTHHLTPTPNPGARQTHWAEILFLVWGKLGGGEVVNLLRLSQGFDLPSHAHWASLRRKGMQDSGSCIPHLSPRYLLALRWDSKGVRWAIVNQHTGSNSTSLGPWVEHVIPEDCGYPSSWETFLGVTSRACSKFFWVYSVLVIFFGGELTF